MSEPFRSKWLESSAETRQYPTDKADKSPFVSIGSGVPARSENLTGSRPDLLRRAGDLAEAITRHLEGCRTCRREHFTTDEVTPCCPVGATLKAEYRKGRAAALASDDLAADH